MSVDEKTEQYRSVRADLDPNGFAEQLERERRTGLILDSLSVTITSVNGVEIISRAKGAAEAEKELANLKLKDKIKVAQNVHTK